MEIRNKARRHPWRRLTRQKKRHITGLFTLRLNSYYNFTKESYLTEIKLATDRIRTDPIGKLLLDYSILAIIGMLVNAIYNIVDRIYIGQGVDVLGTRFLFLFSI
jgi:hypothetical protein